MSKHTKCPECRAPSKGNDGIAEWFHCGSMVFNGETGVNPINQTRDCLERIMACEGINPEAVPDMLAALEGCLEIMSYYHKSLTLDTVHDLDVCENPYNCGHCKAAHAARAAIAKATNGEG